jgi:hypothetical protein
MQLPPHRKITLADLGEEQPVDGMLLFDRRDEAFPLLTVAQRTNTFLEQLLDFFGPIPPLEILQIPVLAHQHRLRRIGEVLLDGVNLTIPSPGRPAVEADLLRFVAREIRHLLT